MRDSNSVHFAQPLKYLTDHGANFFHREELMIGFLLLYHRLKICAAVLKHKILSHLAIVRLCVKDVHDLNAVFDIFKHF